MAKTKPKPKHPPTLIVTKSGRDKLAALAARPRVDLDNIRVCLWNALGDAGFPLRHKHHKMVNATALKLVELLSATPTKGICQYCGCTEEDPCYYVPDLDFDVVPCAWQDNEETVCTHSRCLDKYFHEEKLRRDTGTPLKPVRDEFLCGVALVLGCIMRWEPRSRDLKQLVQMVMQGHGITRDQLYAAGADEYDLKPIPKEK